MDQDRTVSLTISLPKRYRDVLKRMAAELNLEHLDQTVTAAGIVRSIVVEYLDGLEENQREPFDKGNTAQTQGHQEPIFGQAQ